MVIVTGSSGRLGRSVADALRSAGHDVLGLDVVEPSPGAKWRHASVDLTDLGCTLQLVRNADAVIHIAAIPRPTGLPASYVFKNNMTTVYNVVEAAVLNGLSRIVYASSMSVLGFPFFDTPIAPRYLPLDSAHPVAPQDAYALSKWLGEEVVAAAVRRRTNLAAISLRMPWIQTATTFPREVVGRRANPTLVARDLWAYLDVRDAARAFIAAVERPIAGHQRLFISAADTFMDVETDALIRVAYPMTKMRRPLRGHETVFDLAEAEDALGFTPAFGWRDYGDGGK